MANGDIIQLLLFGNGVTIPLISNFTYEQTQGAGASALGTLIGLFKTNVLPDLISICSNVTTFTSIDAKQLTGGTDVVAEPLTTGNVGTATGDYFPPEVCYSFRYFRSTSSSRNGAKRFGIVPRSAFVGTTLVSPFIAATAALASDMSAALTDGTYTWTPRILRQRLNGVTLNPPEVFSFSAVGFIGQGSQNSRKTNRH